MRFDGKSLYLEKQVLKYAGLWQLLCPQQNSWCGQIATRLNGKLGTEACL